MSSDGRVIAKTNAINLNKSADDPENKAALEREIQLLFSFEVWYVVVNLIMPALRTLYMEYRFTKELMVSLCDYSPIVPQGRKKLLGNALWLGFEDEFGSLIHLLCPQVEHIVRSQLKEAGVQTSTLVQTE